jgi:hypothetical protein
MVHRIISDIPKHIRPVDHLQRIHTQESSQIRPHVTCTIVVEIRLDIFPAGVPVPVFDHYGVSSLVTESAVIVASVKIAVRIHQRRDAAKTVMEIIRVFSGAVADNRQGFVNTRPMNGLPEYRRKRVVGKLGNHIFPVIQESPGGCAAGIRSLNRPLTRRTVREAEQRPNAPLIVLVRALVID